MKPDLVHDVVRGGAAGLSISTAPSSSSNVCIPSSVTGPVPVPQQKADIELADGSRLAPVDARSKRASNTAAAKAA